ncbi:hypothetical protein INR49_012387 [Caranx melampygus]|nr:hypothetical protein INR49_012387 [Caranx melampygus]
MVQDRTTSWHLEGVIDKPEKDMTTGASAALFQDARLRWEQPTGWTGASHSHYTCTQRERGENSRQSERRN